LSGQLGRVFWLVINFYLIFIAALLQPGATRPSLEQKFIADVGSTLQKRGWVVQRQPRTHDAAIDPLLNGLDIVAGDGNQVFGVRVKSGGKEPIDWSEGAGLVSAVRAYSEKKPELGTIRPVLLLVDASPGEGLDAFASEQGLQIVQMSRAQEKAN